MSISNEKAIEIKRQLAAFTDYLEHGIDWVKKYYPHHVTFIEDNKEKTYEEVATSINEAFAKI